MTIRSDKLNSRWGDVNERLGIYFVDVLREASLKQLDIFEIYPKKHPSSGKSEAHLERHERHSAKKLLARSESLKYYLETRTSE